MEQLRNKVLFINKSAQTTNTEEKGINLKTILWERSQIQNCIYIYKIVYEPICMKF